MKAILKRILLIVAATTFAALVTAAAMASPLVILVDSSSTSSPLPCRIETRSRIAELLSLAPTGTPFKVIAFSRQPVLVYSGVVSAHDVLSALTALDALKHAGPTDLGSALAFTQQQPLLAHGFAAAIVSDFFIDAPPKSKFADLPLPTLLQAAQLQGARHILLLPVCAFNKAALQQPPPEVDVLGKGMTTSHWIQSLTPPPPPHPQPPPVPFWRRGAFQCATGLALLLALSSIMHMRRQRERRLIQKEIVDVTAPALSNEIEIFPSFDEQEQVQPRPFRRIFRALIQENGCEAVVDTEPVLIGASPLAKPYVEGAVTTLKLTSVMDGAFCIIKNAGTRAAFIGSKRLEPNSSVRLSSDNTAECRLTPTSTLSIYATTEEADHDRA